MKAYKLLSVLVTVLLFSSCNFTEEIIFKEDGSGEFMMNYDMSQMMIAMKEMGGKKPDDSENKKAAKVVDSTIFFKDMLVERADSISKLPQEDQDKLKKLESVIMKMKMNEATDEFVFGFGSSFKNLNELPKLLDNLATAKKMNSKENAQFDKMSSSEVAKATDNTLEHVTFNFDGSTFTRLYKAPKEEVSEEEINVLKTEMSSMGEDAKDIFDNMSYNLVYHFPKKIKSVSNKEATVSNDGKTVTLSLNFLDMVKNPDSNNLEVQLVD